MFFGAYPEGVVAEKNSFRCRYGLAIAKNVEGIASELDAAWNDPKGIANDWKNPSGDSVAYRNGEEAMQALIGLHVHGIEMVRDQRFKPFYKGRDQRVTPNAALFRRSGNTIRAITANVHGLAALWQASGMGALLPKDQRAADTNVLFDYKAAAAAIGRLTPGNSTPLRMGMTGSCLDMRSSMRIRGVVCNLTIRRVTPTRAQVRARFAGAL